MTTPSSASDRAQPGASLAPPPGCPAHGMASDLPKIYGEDASADPLGFYERLRRQYGEVAPVEVPGGLPAWLVLGYQANLTVVRTPSKYARNPAYWSAVQDGTVNEHHPLAPVLLPGPEPLCTHADGPVHMRLRAAVTDSIDQLNRRGMRNAVTRYAHQLIDEFCTTGRADLVAQFADRLPLLVMARLLGMSEETGPQMVKAAKDMLEGTPTSVQSGQYVVEVLARLVEEKRANPGEDIASWLIAHPAQLKDEAVREHLRLILIAAYRTTASLIASTVHIMLTDRRFRADFNGGTMTLPDALEQVLWDHSPFAVLPGYVALGDTRLGEQSIKQGDLLLLGLTAGNADPDVRSTTPSLLGNRSHLSFSGGPHQCPGADIGRGIAETGIDILMTRLPTLELAVPEEELHWAITFMSRDLAELPVTFRPVPPSQKAPARIPAQAAAAPVATPQPAAPAVTAAVAPLPVTPAREVSWFRRLFGRGAKR